MSHGGSCTFKETNFFTKVKFNLLNILKKMLYPVIATLDRLCMKAIKTILWSFWHFLQVYFLHHFLKLYAGELIFGLLSCKNFKDL